MRKSKLTNVSVLDNTGARIVPSMVIGESAGYASGDILDANATNELVQSKIQEVDPEGISEDIQELKTLLGTNTEDLTNAVDTYREVKDFLSDVQNDTPLPQLLAAKVAKSGDTLTGALNFTTNSAIKLSGADAVAYTAGYMSFGNTANPTQIRSNDHIEITTRNNSWTVWDSGNFDATAVSTSLDNLSTHIDDLWSETGVAASVGDVLWNDGTVSGDIESNKAANKTAIAICVASADEFEDHKSRFMALRYMSASADGNTYPEYMWWGDAVSINGATTVTALASAKADVNGYENTRTIIEAVQNYSGFTAVRQCNSFRPGVYDDEWYLPAFGELYYVYTNYDIINSTLDKLQYNFSPYLGTVWSSTLYSSNFAWFLNLNLNDRFGSCGNNYKNGYNSVLAFVAIPGLVSSGSIASYVSNAVSGITVLPDAIIAEEDGLYQIKDYKAYPVSHPDLSTQPSTLPLRYGNLDINEVLIPLGDSCIDVAVGTKYIPNDAMIIECSVFSTKVKVSGTAEYSNEGWVISGNIFSDTPDSDRWVALVRYTQGDKGYYGY